MREREWAGRRVVLAVCVWVAVVVSGSWLVWTVISAAGGSFVDTQGPLPISQGVASSPPARSPAPSTSAPSTSAPAAPTTSSPSASVSPPAASPSSRSRTWSGRPGVVTVRCTGSRITLGGAAVTASGYAVEVSSRGPQRVEVEFHHRSDGGDVTVVSRCRAGSPVFSVTGDD